MNNNKETSYLHGTVYEARDFKVIRMMPGFEIFNKSTKRYNDVASWTDAVAHITCERDARRAS